MRLRALLAATAIAAVALPATTASAATHHRPVVRQFDGTVATVGRAPKRLRLKRSGKASVLFTFTRSTRVAGVPRLAALKRGQVVRITARKTRHGWVARKVAVRVKTGSGTDPATGDDSDTDSLGEDDGDAGQLDQSDDPGGDYADDPGDDGADDPGDGEVDPEA